MGAPDGSTCITREERVVNSLVGLGLLGGSDGEGVDNLRLNGLHRLLGGTSILLLFPDFSSVKEKFFNFYFANTAV